MSQTNMKWSGWEAAIQRTDSIASSNGDSVAEIQQRLNELLYDAGKVDGIVGMRTLCAAKWFFIRNGLGENINWTQQSLNVLYSANAVKGLDYDIINWEPGEAPQAYLQKDPLWGDVAYDASGTSGVETIGEAGCGPTAMAMVVSTLKTTAVVPPYLCDYALDHGYRDPNGEYGTSDSFFRACAEEYGLNSARRNFITKENASSSARASNKALFEDMKQFLATDSLIIVSVGESPYTGGGHYLVVYDIDNTSNIEDAKVWVADPNGHSEDYPNAILPANYCYTVRQWLNGYWAKRAIRIWP